jgi:hypothetical protein
MAASRPIADIISAVGLPQSGHCISKVDMADFPPPIDRVSVDTAGCHFELLTVVFDTLRCMDSSSCRLAAMMFDYANTFTGRKTTHRIQQ